MFHCCGDTHPGADPSGLWTSVNCTWLIMHEIIFAYMWTSVFSEWMYVVVLLQWCCWEFVLFQSFCNVQHDIFLRTIYSETSFYPLRIEWIMKNWLFWIRVGSVFQHFFLLFGIASSNSLLMNCTLTLGKCFKKLYFDLEFMLIVCWAGKWQVVQERFYK